MADTLRIHRAAVNGGLRHDLYTSLGLFYDDETLDPTNQPSASTVPTIQGYDISGNPTTISLEDLFTAGMIYTISYKIHYEGDLVAITGDNFANVQKQISETPGHTCRIVGALISGCGSNSGESSNSVIVVGNRAYGVGGSTTSTITIAFDAQTTALIVMDIPLDSGPGYLWPSSVAGHGDVEITIFVEVLPA